MSRLYVARRKTRRGLLIPQSGTKASPNLLFPLDGTDRGELDELIRAILAKQGITAEAEVQAIVDAAERDSEVRQKIHETRKEIRRLMGERAKGLKLMQVGFRKWRPAWYRPIPAKE